MIQTIKPFIVAEVTHGQTDRQTDGQVTHS